MREAVRSFSHRKINTGKLENGVYLQGCPALNRHQLSGQRALPSNVDGRKEEP